MTNTKKVYPIAEMFDSVQGEGLYTGCRMWFLRVAGCSVGKKMTELERKEFSELEGVETLQLYREKCTLYDGRTFACDTNFSTKSVLSVEEIVNCIPVGVEHICLTGGEPLDHPLQPLLEKLASYGLAVHVETSGTVSITERAYPAYSWGDSLETKEGWLWITVSPKKGILPEMIGLANEIKLLVDENFDVAKVPEDILDHRLVYIQPINFEFEINQENTRRCLQLLQEHPNWRLSSQAHKIWRVR